MKDIREGVPSELSFEIGPIRPPSEARSLLLRITRNCPWNKCEFCITYKGKKFSRRSVEEVKKDIDTIKEIADFIKEISWRLGSGGVVDERVIRYLLAGDYNESFLMVAGWLMNGGKTVFLQDANQMVYPTDGLCEILSYLKEKFPQIERITTYARSSSIAKRKTVEDLKKMKEAGLTRVHIGLETGDGFLLNYVKKGATPEDHIDAGKKVMEADLELSEYVILGLGGKKWWVQHAENTARVLNEISPHFIRLRTLKVIPGTPLYDKMLSGDWVPQTEDEKIIEEKKLIENLDCKGSYFVSDHILNLLEEVEGYIPHDKDRMLSIIDKYLSMSEEMRKNYRLGRRIGIYRYMEDMEDIELFEKVERYKKGIEERHEGGVDAFIDKVMERFI